MVLLSSIRLPAERLQGTRHSILWHVDLDSKCALLSKLINCTPIQVNEQKLYSAFVGHSAFLDDDDDSIYFELSYRGPHKPI